MQFDAKKDMQYDAKKEMFEIVEVSGIRGLFCNMQIDKSTVPPELNFYEVIEKGGKLRLKTTLEKSDWTNHWGTFLSKSEVPLENGYYALKNNDIIHPCESCTLMGYLQMEDVNPEEALGLNMDM